MAYSDNFPNFQLIMTSIGFYRTHMNLNFINGIIFHLFTDHNRLVGQQQTPTATVTTNTSPKTGSSPRSSLRTNASIKLATTPPNALSLRNGTIILETSHIQPKSKGKDVENNNSVKVTNKNNANTNKIQQQQQQLLLQQLAEQQALEKQKQMLEARELLHANKSVEALGVLVQYLVFNVSTKI